MGKNLSKWNALGFYPGLVGGHCISVDPFANEKEVFFTYKKELTPISKVKDADCIVFAAAHNIFKDLSFKDIDAMYIPNMESKKIIIDIKHIFNKDIFENNGYLYWSL